MQKISQLPPEGQSAMSFVIKNFHFIKKMCENTEMTDEKFKTDRQKPRKTATISCWLCLRQFRYLMKNNTNKSGLRKAF